MRVILSGAVVMAAFIGFSGMISPVLGQSVRAVGGPAEVPSAKFQGQQYVDSRGCVFMRAGLGGRTQWVARIGRDRKPMCSETTAREASARLAAPDAAASNPAAPVVVAAAPVMAEKVGKPMATVASNMVPKRHLGVQIPTFVPGLEPAKTPAAQVAPSYSNPALAPKPARVQIANGTTVGRSAGCPAAVPVLQRMALNAGGTVMVCTRGDGTANGWVSPTYARGTAPGASIKNVPGAQVAFSGNTGTQIAAQRRTQTQGTGAQANGQANGDFAQVVIDGKTVIGHQQQKQTQYRTAWRDGRLNPLRGQGSASGWAQQDQVWTRATPAKSVADIAQTKVRRKNQQQANLRVSASTMSGGGLGSGGDLGGAVASGAAIYVQIGTFGSASNVKNAAGMLASMGLPVAKSHGKRGGQELVTVLAGPFASRPDAQAALGMARGAGFADAFLR